jgi:hypothetical protein
MDKDNTAKCGICGEPMPPGEQMFKHHGYSGKCPKPPLKKVEIDPASEPKQPLTLLESRAIKVLNTLKAAADGEVIQLPLGIRMEIDALIAFSSARREGVK